jgi:hypothetical protein
MTTSEQARADAETHFSPGTEVEALDPHTLCWRRGWVENDAPYRVRGRLISAGAYIRWRGVKEQWESTGGWQPARCIRAVPGLRG